MNRSGRIGPVSVLDEPFTRGGAPETRVGSLLPSSSLFLPSFLPPTTPFRQLLPPHEIGTSAALIDKYHSRRRRVPMHLTNGLHHQVVVLLPLHFNVSQIIYPAVHDRAPDFIFLLTCKFIFLQPTNPLIRLLCCTQT